MDRGTERPTCPEEGRPESLSKNSWEEKKICVMNILVCKDKG